jgi:hypothetical protein
MTPTQQVPRVGECAEMLLEDLVLDELDVVLLLDRNEHAHDIPQQVTPAFRDAVQEQWPLKLALSELAIFFIQRVGLQIDFDIPHRGGAGRWSWS